MATADGTNCLVFSQATTSWWFRPPKYHVFPKLFPLFLVLTADQPNCLVFPQITTFWRYFLGIYISFSHFFLFYLPTRFKYLVFPQKPTFMKYLITTIWGVVRPACCALAPQGFSRTLAIFCPEWPRHTKKSGKSTKKTGKRILID